MHRFLGGEAEFPGFVAHVKGHQQGRLGCVTVFMMGRCGSHGFLLHGDRLSVMEKKLTNSGLLRKPADKHRIYLNEVAPKRSNVGTTLKTSMDTT